MGFRPFRVASLRSWAWIGVAALCLAGCNESNIPKAQRPVPYALTAAMAQRDMTPTSPILIRLFKESSELEVWKQTRSGTFALLKTYQICKWSGDLGPKKKEGDRQAPEGFYTVTPAQMNPKSSYYLSFNIGYPNAYDRSLGRTGSNLMVHGACSSAGCYSMTDEDAGELFALARDSFRGGQTSFQIAAFPFRMTPENMARHRDNPNMDFWRTLKIGYDSFELTHRTPKVDVCNQNYVFNADAGGAAFNASLACPPYTVPTLLAQALEKRQAEDAVRFNEAVAALDAKAAKAADDEAAALARAEAKKARAEERANEPSFLSRLVGRKVSAAQPPPAEPAASPAVSLAPAEKPVETALAAAAPVPKPHLRPVTAGAAVSPVPAAAPVVAATTAEPAKPAVGRFVKKQFLWPEDDDQPADAL